MEKGVSALRVPVRIMTLVILMLLNGCTKEDLMTKEELLTDGKWTIRSYNIIPGLNDPDMLVFYDACERDNFLQFYSNKTGEFNEGATKCDPRDQQSELFTWSLNESETKITIDNREVEIAELSGSRFALSFNRFILGLDRRIVITYQH
jgi:Lipocalin-like domain